MNLINQDLAALVGGLIIPLIVAAITKAEASSKLRAVVAAVLAVVAGPIATWVADNGEIVSRLSTRSAAFAWIMTLVSYTAAWKVLDINGRAFPRFGLGKATSDE